MAAPENDKLRSYNLSGKDCDLLYFALQNLPMMIWAGNKVAIECLLELFKPQGEINVSRD